jgi:triphosphoribosyl-dephospho-CoA synthase
MQSPTRSLPDPNCGSDESCIRARRVAALAVHALIAEVELTPKPALVDERGPGAHADLSPSLMSRSARSLLGAFERMALVSFGQVPSLSLREELGLIGRAAERSMLLITKGVNTHRGSIWALGLLVSAAAMGSDSPRTVARWAGQLARLPDLNRQPQNSNGMNAFRRYRVPGARGEAEAGFPHALQNALPVLYQSRRQGAVETDARINALLAIMTSLGDTCLLHRGGWTALHTAQRGAAAVLTVGGVSTVRGWKLLQRLDRDLTALNASPGGSADMLASTLFLDSLVGSPFTPR